MEALGFCLFGWLVAVKYQPSGLVGRKIFPITHVWKYKCKDKAEIRKGRRKQRRRHYYSVRLVLLEYERYIVPAVCLGYLWLSSFMQM